MTESIFKVVLSMSLTGGVLSLIFFILQNPLKKFFGHKLNYYIWIFLMVLMLIPFSFEFNNFSVGDTDNINTGTVQYDLISDNTQASLQQSKNVSKSPLADSDNSLTWFCAFSRIWLICALGIFAIRIIQYIMFLTTVKKHSVIGERHKQASIKYTDLIFAPFTVGLFKKTVLIPQKYKNTTEEEYIINHEMTHIKNKDIYVKWLCTLIKTVHWFNPCAYLISKIIDEECEYVCDVSVTKNMKPHEKKQYMNTILSCLCASNNSASSFTTNMADKKSNIVKRFEHIVNSRPQNRFRASLSLMIFAIFMIFGISVSAFFGYETYNGNLPSVRITLEIPGNDKRADKNQKTQTAAIVEKSANTEKEIQDNPVSASDNSKIINPAKNEEPPAKAGDEFDSQSQTTAGNTSYSDDFVMTDTKGENVGLEPDLSQSHNDAPLSNESESNASPKTDEYDEVSYPGDMVGYILLEDWNTEKMITDLENGDYIGEASDSLQAGKTFVSGEISYESGNAVTLKNVTSSQKGRVCLYMDSDYEQLIEIAFILDGKQICGMSFVPDGETFYIFGGFDPTKKYDIIISNPNGSTWKTTAEYVVC